ncbi:DUF397 domain-containing protein [Streptomyces sp. DSM 15324]|uniref:DUF397 domain-containing protein n=1 Tax=Streptomyces sp. DSM 15324 TaxID=1739111 RepID=UPI00074A9236|nr:DUF397 domain-containing protein [Streptomyces sp. DSM 15324]KUO06958.1 toxin [Streptomyces sp. DSM 15324]
MQELVWFKSSYSGGNEGDSCLEVALDWFKSSYSSGSEGDSCLEVAATPTLIHVRDSKQLEDGPTFQVTGAAWTAFLSYASGA